MARKHILSLDFPVTNNLSILKIVDSSLYSQELEVDCSILTITSPGFVNPVIIEVDPMFNLNLCACNLGIVTNNCDTDYSFLPDGIYEIEYSVSPNDKVYVKYGYLRTVAIREKLYEKYCNLGLNACTPNNDILNSISQLNNIENYIKIAELSARCGDNTKAMELLQYANKLLDKLNCKHC